MYCYRNRSSCKIYFLNLLSAFNNQRPKDCHLSTICARYKHFKPASTKDNKHHFVTVAALIVWIAKLNKKHDRKPEQIVRTKMKFRWKCKFSHKIRSVVDASVARQTASRRANKKPQHSIARWSRFVKVKVLFVTRFSNFIQETQQRTYFCPVWDDH